jgi:class 3 adenylate cyclase
MCPGRPDFEDAPVRTRSALLLALTTAALAVGAAPSAALSEPDAGSAAGRRLVAILHADMVGYSRLVQLDELGTLSRLRAIRDGLVAPLIGAGGGRVVNTAGDSVLAAFNSVTAAVRCAVELQRAVAEWETGPPDRRIRFRVGVELSDVPAADGTTIQGHGVNVAARLQAACPPGRVCVSRAVRDQLHGRAEFRFEALGPLALKNIAGPVEAFLVCEGVAPPRWRASAGAVLRAVRRRRWPALGTAALLSGAAFWAISGIWLEREPGGPNYAWNFLCWTFAYFPGFAALLVSRARPRYS